MLFSLALLILPLFATAHTTKREERLAYHRRQAKLLSESVNAEVSSNSTTTNTSNLVSKKPSDQRWGFNYGVDKVRGVNIGGWLVLEPWITPSIFEKTGDNRIVDEWTFSQYQDKAVAASVLKTHWDTWITEDDFAAISQAGLNHVRIPIGFWAFEVSGGEPYTQGQLPYLTKAIGWAAKYNLKVIVDLHGVPGSQNGFDNSGRRGSANWVDDQNNIKRSNAIIKKIADMFKDDYETASIIEPLNEPTTFISDAMQAATKQYWMDSYGNVRYPYGNARQSNSVVMIHDGFQSLDYWKGFLTPDQGYQGVALDTHIYQMFNVDQVSLSDDDHIKQACANGPALSSFDLWVIVGEWTPAATDCAKYLNGRGVGTRFEGQLAGSSYIGKCSDYTGSGASFTSEYKTFLGKYWEAQTSAFEQGEGWIQWTWKAESADDWSYQAGLKYGWIPKTPTDRRYPNICS